MSNDLWKQLESAIDEDARQSLLSQMDQRAKQGFSDYDVGDAAGYLAGLLPAILERLASTTDVYPQGFDNLEDWQHHLRWVAAIFREAREFELACKNDEADEKIKFALQQLGENFWNLWFRGECI